MWFCQNFRLLSVIRFTVKWPIIYSKLFLVRIQLKCNLYWDFSIKFIERKIWCKTYRYIGFRSLLIKVYGLILKIYYCYSEIFCFIADVDMLTGENYDKCKAFTYIYALVWNFRFKTLFWYLFEWFSLCGSNLYLIYENYLILNIKCLQYETDLNELTIF